MDPGCKLSPFLLASCGYLPWIYICVQTLSVYRILQPERKAGGGCTHSRCIVPCCWRGGGCTMGLLSLSHLPQLNFWTCQWSRQHVYVVWFRFSAVQLKNKFISCSMRQCWRFIKSPVLQFSVKLVWWTSLGLCFGSHLLPRFWVLTKFQEVWPASHPLSHLVKDL